MIGLRTRAGIRAYQKAENLPLTDRLDKETAVSESPLRFARRQAARSRQTSLRQAQRGPKVRDAPARHPRSQSRNRSLVKADRTLQEGTAILQTKRPSAVPYEHICSDLPRPDLLRSKLSRCAQLSTRIFVRVLTQHDSGSGRTGNRKEAFQ